MSRRITWATLIFGVSLASAAPESGDIALSLPYAAKAVAPFLLLPAALDDGDDVLKVNLLLFGAVTVPNSLTLYHAWSRNGPATSLWRKISLAVDASMAIGIAGYALHGLATLDDEGPGGYEGLGYTLMFLSSIPVALVVSLDLIPFSAEHARFTAAPILVPGESGFDAGAMAALQLDF